MILPSLPLEWSLSLGGNVIKKTKKQKNPLPSVAVHHLEICSLYTRELLHELPSIAQKILMWSDMLYTNLCIERYQFRHQFVIMVIQQNNNSRFIQSLLALGQIYRTMHASSLVELALNPTRKQLITP